MSHDLAMSMIALSSLKNSLYLCHVWDYFLKLKRQIELEASYDTVRPSYMVLKGTYGEKIHKIFRMSRQGVRWRFQRLFVTGKSNWEIIFRKPQERR